MSLETRDPRFPEKSYKPLSGYDLKTELRCPRRPPFLAGRSKPNLRPHPQPLAGGRQNAAWRWWIRPTAQFERLYHITPAGKQELLRWAGLDLEVEPARSPQMIQALFAANPPDEAILSSSRMAPPIFARRG